jgi:hydroxyacid-oxoacid transhydrogenase
VQPRSFPTETVFAMEATPIKFGPGVTAEVGYDLQRLGVRNALIVTDPTMDRLGLADQVRRAVEAEGAGATVFDGVHVEPTDESFEAAIRFARDGAFDGFVGLGGGSALDTAKAANLYSSYPADLFEYINQPTGRGAAVPGPLRPLVAIPTTSGTGSETTAVAVLDVLELKLKMGIAHRFLRPSLALVDPLNTLTCPPEVTAASGLDALFHALESYTCRRYDARPPWPSPASRPIYLGGNPISDLWCEKAIELVGRALRRAVANGHDLEARTDMAMAATFASVGFGNSGVHIPHTLAYPIAGRVTAYHPAGYPGQEPLIPHGTSVSVTAPASFRYTYPAGPERHLRAAELLGADVRGVSELDGRELLPAALVGLMRDVGVPNGLEALGYAAADVPDLVEGGMKQQRMHSGCPRPLNPTVLGDVLRQSLRLW